MWNDILNHDVNEIVSYFLILLYIYNFGRIERKVAGLYLGLLTVLAYVSWFQEEIWQYDITNLIHFVINALLLYEFIFHFGWWKSLKEKLFEPSGDDK